jgi:hypothetical protein
MSAAEKDAAPAPTAFWAGTALLALVLCALRESVRALLSPLSWVDLPIHETGHLVFGLLGNQFIYVLGGTLGQLLMPLAFWVYFLNENQPRSADACLLWVGQNLLDIGRYAADARAQQLELVAGGVHDWTYLLETTHLLIHDAGVGRAFDCAGCALIAFAAACIVRRTRAASAAPPA